MVARRGSEDAVVAAGGRDGEWDRDMRLSGKDAGGADVVWQGYGRAGLGGNEIVRRQAEGYAL